MHEPSMPHDLLVAVMLAGIALVLLVGVALGRVARAVRQPAVIGEIVAGILLGPSVLGALPGDLPQVLFPTDVRPLLSAVANVGLVLFMFGVGWEFEKRLVRPHVGLAAAVSLSSVALSFALGAAIGAWLHPRHSTVGGAEVPVAAFVIFMGTAMAVTAFPVLARILTDNRLMGTRVGTLAIASAAVDDVLAWFMLALVSGLVSSGGALGGLLLTGALSAVYVLGMFVLVRPLLARLVRSCVDRASWPSLFVLLAAGAFLSSWLTSWIGIHAIFGAFLFGFVMPREPAALLAAHVRARIDDVSLVLLPVFFIVTGLQVDLGGLHGRDWPELVAVIVVACVGKFVGSAAPARLSGLSWRESGVLGVLMNTRGLTELIILNAAVSLGVLDGRMFTMMVVMALVTTVVAGPLLPRQELGDPSVGREAPGPRVLVPK